MQLCKKITLTVLSVVSCGFITGMETDIKEVSTTDASEKKVVFLLPKTSENQAWLLAAFARQSNDPSVAHRVAKWLILQRKNTVEDKEWTTFVDSFITRMEGSRCLCPCSYSEKLTAVTNIVKDTMYGLRPDEDCAQTFVDRALEALGKVQQQ